MNTESRITPAFRFRNAVGLLAIALLATGLLAACSGDGDDAETAAALAALEAQLQQLSQAPAMEEPSEGAKAGVTLQVDPVIFKFPARRLSDSGVVWFYGSGLEAGQWFRILVRAEGEVAELMDFGPETLRQANDDGSFGITLPGIRPDRFQGVPEGWGIQGGVWAVELWDMDSGEVLATTPWVICGSAGENEWCPAALETAAVPEPVEGSGTTWDIARIRIQDGNFQLRMGADAYWGYDAEARIDSNAGDGWVMTIALGDTVALERLENRTDSGMNHNFTIAELGIDVAMTPDQRIEPYKLKPDKAGEFVIDDSSDSGEHGKALLIVTE